MGYKENFISELRAIVNSGRFTAYTAGVPLTLPTGENVIVKVKHTVRSVRPPGLRFSKHAFITEVTAGEHLGVGFGESESQLVAIQKSIAEGVERSLFRAFKNAGV